MKKIVTLLLICLVAVAAFNASAVNASIYEIDEGSLVGDVNYDSKVNVTDVTTLVNMILGVVPKDMERADIDNNGKINVSDVTALINVILGITSGGTSGGTKLQMQEWFENSALLPYIPMHEWTDGDVIFLAIDPVDNEVCQNVYAIERVGSKWVFRDVNGSNKQGFKTSGGTVSAVYVQDANLAECYYNYIPITRDVACVSKAGTYTVTPKNGKYYITLNGLYFYHFVSRIDVNAAQEGDYFYGSVTHLDALTKVSWMPTYGYGAFETSHRAPVIDIDSNHKGHAYGVWQMGTRVDGWLSLDYVKSNGYAYYWNYGQNKLYQGRYLTSIYSPWQNAWNRDLSMRYYNYDENKSYRLNASTPSAQDVNINVGTNIIFRPYDGDNTDSNGTMTSVTSSASGIIDINYDNTQVSVVAHKVGTTTLTIKFKTKDGINTTYTYNVTVNPTVWAAGKSADNKPIVWRNWQDKSGRLGGKDNYNAATKILVHGSNATVLYRKDNVGYKTYYDETYDGTIVSYDYYFYTGGTAAIAKATGAHGGGYFNIYTSELEGSQHKLNRYFNFEGAPRMWTDKNGNVYYTTSTRSTQNDSEGENNGCVVNTSVYKNKTKLLTIDNFVITDLAVSESTGKIYVIGNSTNSQQVVGSLGVITGSTPQYYPITPPANDYWIFTRMYLDQNTETVYIEGLNGHYSTVNGGSGYICRYTASNGLSQYTDVDLKTASNYCFINSKSVWDRTLGVNEGLRCYPFILNANKFYVFNNGASGNAYNKIYTYQLGTSQIAEYTTYPNGTKPMFFDIKNNMIGMVLFNGAGKPYQVMSCGLNSAITGVAMENSAGALIYDVYMQTSLDN
jgi:hypothetical protein